MNNSIPETLARAGAVQQARPVRYAIPREWMQEIAERLTLKGKVVATAELMNAVIETLTNILYQYDDDNAPANFDADGRILIVVPWSRQAPEAWTHKGRPIMSRSEINALRYVMMTRARNGACPYRWDPLSRAWYVSDRSKRASALYWKNYPITPEEWKGAMAASRRLGGVQGVSDSCED